MSISELVSVLHVAYKMQDFDEVEEELVNREAKLRAEIGPLQEKIELERLNTIEAEEKLEILKIRVAELRARIRVLKEEKVGDKSALDSLNMQNIELEEAVKKNLTLIEGLRAENSRLKDEKHELKRLFESLERRYSELGVNDVKLKENTMLLMSESASDCENTEVELNPRVSYALRDEEDFGDHDDAAAAARCTSQGLHGQKTISQIVSENKQRVEMLKRKRASDIQASNSASTPSADFLETDNLPVKGRSKLSNQYYM